MKTNLYGLNQRLIPDVRFNSDYFKCPNCGYAEHRKIMGDTSYTACPECGHSPMFRVK